MLIIITLVTAAAIVLLISLENERIRKAKHRAQTRYLLNYIENLDVKRSYQLHANATATGWEG